MLTVNETLTFLLQNCHFVVFEINVLNISVLFCSHLMRVIITGLLLLIKKLILACQITLCVEVYLVSN